MNPTLYELLMAPKTLVMPPKRRVKAHPSHAEIDVPIACEMPGEFVFFARVSLDLAESYTLGLRYEAPGFRSVPILRVNGDHGAHSNPDKTRFTGGPHVHMAEFGYLCLPADGERRDQYAVQIDENILTPLAAWPLFRFYSNIEDSAQVRECLTRLRAIPGNGQMELFGEG